MFTGGKGPKKSLIDSLKSMKSQVPAFLSKKAGSKSDKEGEAADNEESKELLDKKDEGGDDEKEGLRTNDAKQYISTAALLNYIAPDRPSIQFGIKECLRKSSSPNKADETRLKRVCKYLVGRPREVLRFGWRDDCDKLYIYADSDFAGCPRTRKSTAGGVATVGGHLLKTWSKTIPVLCLSSGEAELMALVRAGAEALGLRALYEDFGINMSITIGSDATAAIGMVSRLGLGRVRHLAVSDLWLQERSRSGDMTFQKVPGHDNPSDALTKAVDHITLDRHLETMGFVSLDGRPEIAPKAKSSEENGSK